jgi:hypothetical protein
MRAVCEREANGMRAEPTDAWRKLSCGSAKQRNVDERRPRDLPLHVARRELSAHEPNRLSRHRPEPCQDPTSTVDPDEALPLPFRLPLDDGSPETCWRMTSPGLVHDSKLPPSQLSAVKGRSSGSATVCGSSTSTRPEASCLMMRTLTTPVGVLYASAAWTVSTWCDARSGSATVAVRFA